MTKIGIIREGKIPIDKRVPLTPVQARLVKDKFSGIELVVQSSDIRCFDDSDYEKEGIDVVESLEDCDIILGVKEVPLEDLLPNKTYFFFSHTIKKQPYNQPLLKKVVEKNIRLIDYEVLTNENGKRIVAFGRWAGIVGAYNGIWTFGKRYNLYNLRRAHECFDLEDLKTEFSKVKLPAIKIAITGGGRVSKGAMEVMHGMNIKKVTPRDLIEKEYHEPVFAQLNTRDYNRKKDNGLFDRSDFYANPSSYESDFLKFAHVSDILIASAFWDPHAPVLFHPEDVLKGDFKISVIADITCDIEGSIPSTKKPATIEDPIYDYNPSNDKVEEPLTDEANISVMAVDNLPCELPRDASDSFGNELVNNVLPELLGNDEKRIIERATITENGKLTKRFTYLTDYLNGKES